MNITMPMVLLVLGVIAMVIVLVSLVVSSADRRRECEEKKQAAKEAAEADERKRLAAEARAKAEMDAAAAKAKTEENEAKLVHAIVTDPSTAMFEKGPFSGMIKVVRVPAAVSVNQGEAIKLCKETDLTVGDLRLKTGPGATTLEAMAKVEAAKRGGPLAIAEAAAGAVATGGMVPADKETGLPQIHVHFHDVPFVKGTKR